jgi:hypothetical protein
VDGVLPERGGAALDSSSTFIRSSSGRGQGFGGDSSRASVDGSRNQRLWALTVSSRVQVQLRSEDVMKTDRENFS